MSTTKTIACGNRKAHGFTPGFQHHHHTVAQVRECHASPYGLRSVEEDSQTDLDTYDPDAVHERHLESAGYNEARLQEDVEAAMGVASFEDAAVEAAQEAQPMEANPDFAGLPDGTYTVVLNGTHRTFTVKTQKDDAKFAPGKRILSVLSGPDNEGDYVGIAFIGTTSQGEYHLGPWKKFHESGDLTQEAAQRLLDDPREALVAGRCARCQRLLSTPDSLTRGLGPECAGKIGA